MSEKKSAPTLFFPYLMAGILVLSAFILPSFSLRDSWPKVQLVELLLPVYFVMVWLPLRNREMPSMNTYLLILALSLCSILVSILANGRWMNIRDHFEEMKVIKFTLLMFFVILWFPRLNYRFLLETAFYLSLIFNFFHYVDLFGFNHTVEPLYGDEIQVSTFGLNSLGEPDTKRILGTMGNPNNNAVLFLFFSIFFFPEKGADLRKRIIFYVSVFAVFACQSRTGFIALAVVYFLGAWLLHFSARNYFFDLLIFSGMYGVEILLGNIYIGSLAGNIMQQHSVRGRLETWKMLWEMIRLKPVLGYGPYKEYFYDNKIYPENEYILYTWRYGFAGLLIYCWWLGYSVFTGWRDRQRRESINLLLFTVVMVITAITNTPLTSTYILIMFAILSGLYFAGKNPNVAIE